MSAWWTIHWPFIVGWFWNLKRIWAFDFSFVASTYRSCSTYSWIVSFFDWFNRFVSLKKKQILVFCAKKIKKVLIETINLNSTGLRQLKELFPVLKNRSPHFLMKKLLMSYLEFRRYERITVMGLYYKNAHKVEICSNSMHLL